MIPALGETRVFELLAEQAARYADMTDDQVTLSETPRFDARMREWAKGYVAMSPEERFKANHGWPAEHRHGDEACACKVCSVPLHLRGNTALLRAREARISALRAQEG